MPLRASLAAAFRSAPIPAIVLFFCCLCGIDPAAAAATGATPPVPATAGAAEPPVAATAEPPTSVPPPPVAATAAATKAASRGGPGLPPVRAVTHGPKFHWFGYYDVLEFDPTGRYLLGMEVGFENRSPAPGDTITVGMIDLKEGDRWIPLGTSRAWCWQQGCRLQWRPGSLREILWNDREGGRFVCRILDVETGRLRTLPRPIYHVAPGGRRALGTDFARLNDMRPGYGYAGIEDPRKDEAAPGDSGIYEMDLDTGESRLLFSLADIAAIPYPNARPGDKHYFNHIEWNPSGTRFLFLDRWRPAGGRGFATRMFTADADGKGIRLVTDRPGVSHYCWRDDSHILIYREGGYRLYRDDGSGKETLVFSAVNGHQTYLPGKKWLLTDTYPQGPGREQIDYLYHIPTGRKVVLGRFPSPPEYRGEWRVDTHPRLGPDGTKVAIDSAHGGEGRQIHLIDIGAIVAAGAPRVAANAAAPAEGGANAAAPARGTAAAAASAPSPPGAGLAKRAAAWIEAENARPAKGIDVDRRKAATTSGGLCLGVHGDKVREAAAAWRIDLAREAARARLALRFASEESGRFRLVLDGKDLGLLALPATGGWGYRPGEWRWGLVALESGIAAGGHVLELENAAPRPVNLDCLAILDNPGPPMILLSLEKGDEAEPSFNMVLPEWRTPGDMEETPFSLGAGKGRYRSWGRAGPEERFFFPEFLPALFERTLVLDEGDPALRLEWIFTGPRGGFTVEISKNGPGAGGSEDTVKGGGTGSGGAETMRPGDGKGRSGGGGTVRLYQRYYDSPGFNAVNKKTPRHPEWRTPAAAAAFTGKLRSVTVTLDHRLRLSVALNGGLALRQECLFDITRHQLELAGKNAALSGRLLAPRPAAARVRVDPEERHQTMIGFGGITTPTAYAELSPEGKKRWWKIVAEYNLLVQREYPIGSRLDKAMDNWDRIADATPHYYGDNFPNGEISDFAYIRTLRRLGGKVLFEFWALPPWTGDDPEKYAAAMVSYCKASLAKAGAPPDVVGIQNEVTHSAATYQAMTRALRKALDTAGFKKVRIHMSDHGSLAGGIARARKFKAAKDVWGMIDYAATHMYDYQSFFSDPDGYDSRLAEWKRLTGDKPFLSTELCVNSSKYQRPSYRLAFSMGQLYQKNLVLADAVLICYCWTLLNVEQPSYGWTRTLCVPDRASGFVPAPSSGQLRVFGAFSRRVRAGMVRLGAKSDDPDLLAAAFAGEKGSATLILLNRGTRPLEAALSWPGARFAWIETVDPYHQNSVRPAPEAAGTRTVTIAPGAIATITNVPLGNFATGS